MKKLKEQKFSLCALNNHEKFLQFVFHNFVWSASLEKANARLLEELQEKELEYANLQEEVRDLNDKLNKARIQHSKELGTIGHSGHCKSVQEQSLYIVKACKYYNYGLIWKKNAVKIDDDIISKQISIIIGIKFELLIF